MVCRSAAGIVVLCAVCTVCTVAPAWAQEIVLTGPLAGAPALIPPPTWRAARVELGVTPGLSFGANDSAALLAGGEAHYFPWDRLGAGVWATAAFPVGDGESELHAAAAPELVFVPVVGKASTFEHAHMRFDLHLLGGPAWVAAEGPGDERSIVPMAGIGFRGFSAKFFSNSLDYRLLFGDPVRHVVTLSFSFWPLPVRTAE